MAMTAQAQAPAPLGAEYGDPYLTWKDWDAAGFAQLRKTDAIYFDAELARTGAALPPGSQVLEVGFGNGGFLRYGRQRNWAMQGTEVNPALVETARRHGFDAIHTDTLQVFADASFDLVAAFDVLEHIPSEHLLGFLAEIRRVLKPGGVCISRFPNGDSPFGLLNQNADVTHVNVMGSGKCRYFIAKLGLEPVRVGGEAEPLLGGSLLGILHRLVALPIKKALNLFVNQVFFPRMGGVSFLSANLVMVFRRPAS